MGMEKGTKIRKSNKESLTAKGERRTMSNALKKYRKNLAKSSYRFDMDMYNNILGSLVISNWAVTEQKENEIDTINKIWKRLKKNGRYTDKDGVNKKLDFWLDDPDFITKALSIFGLTPQWGKFAMVQSGFNTLFLPYVDDTILPVREDGVYPASAFQGKIYPVTGENDIKGEEC